MSAEGSLSGGPKELSYLTAYQTNIIGAACYRVHHANSWQFAYEDHWRMGTDAAVLEVATGWGGEELPTRRERAPSKAYKTLATTHKRRRALRGPATSYRLRGVAVPDASTLRPGLAFSAEEGYRIE
jgi:hypothetical protein